MPPGGSATGHTPATLRLILPAQKNGAEAPDPTKGEGGSGLPYMLRRYWPPTL